jgi:hypothetical protein
LPYCEKLHKKIFGKFLAGIGSFCVSVEHFYRDPVKGT